MLDGIERAPYWLTEIIRRGKEADINDENFAWWVLTAFRVNHFQDQEIRERSFEFAMRLAKDHGNTVENVSAVLREAQRIAEWIESGPPPTDTRETESPAT